MQNDNNEDQQLQKIDTQATSSAPIPPFSPEVTPFRDAKKQKPRISKKTLVKILGGIGAVLLIALATLAYLLLVNNKPESNSDKPASGLSILLDSINSSLKNPSVVTALVQEPGNVSSVTKNIKDNIWVMADNSSSVLSLSSERDSANLNESDYKSVVGALKSADFTLSTGSDYSATNYTLQSYSSQSFVCSLRNTPAINENNDLSKYTLQINCANQSDFSKNTEDMKSAIDAYATKVTNDKDLLFSNLIVQTSGTEGYKNAYINVSDLDNSIISKGLFYIKTDSNWSYFKTTDDQDKIDCSEYNNEDVISAYVGVPCWDSSTGLSAFVSKPDQVIAPNPGDKSSGSGG